MKLNNPYSLYSTCINIRGIKRSLLHDIQRYKLHYIPNDLHDILINFDGKSINEIIQHFGEDSHEIIMEYFDLLVKNDLIHFCEKEELKYFTKETYSWDSPSVISNAVVEYANCYDLSSLLYQLEQLGCYYIYFIFHEPLDQISDLLEKTIKSNYRSFDLVIKDDGYNTEYLKVFLKKHLRIRQLILYNSKKDEVIMGGIDGEGKILFSKESLNHTKKSKTFTIICTE